MTTLSFILITICGTILYIVGRSMSDPVTNYKLTEITVLDITFAILIVFIILVCGYHANELLPKIEYADCIIEYEDISKCEALMPKGAK